MGYFRIAPMAMADVPEVMRIERESFTHTWPGDAYRKELHDNQNAHYLVLRCAPEEQHLPDPESPTMVERRGLIANLGRLANRWLLGNELPAPASLVTLAGYAGLWLVVDEAHITTIAVRPQFRGRGLGEWMLVALTDIAIAINARWLTLEVRVSNGVAQALYRKDGFKPAGVRHRYYSDNQEDALIMWTEELRTPAFQERFRALRESLHTRLAAAGDIMADDSAWAAP